MRLEIGNILIKDIAFGSKTEVKDGTLFVDKDELIEAATGGDERIKSLDVI
jgi:Glycine/sarcosine/betaine reductase component B subunits.